MNAKRCGSVSACGAVCSASLILSIFTALCTRLPLPVQLRLIRRCPVCGAVASALRQASLKCTCFAGHGSRQEQHTDLAEPLPGKTALAQVPKYIYPLLILCISDTSVNVSFSTPEYCYAPVSGLCSA